MSEVTKKKIKSPGIALEVKNVSKSFRLPTEQASGIKQAFINRVRGVKGYTEQHVLKNISFKVEEGDFFGIVGRNGSGKSTLLKLISQIYVPDSGKIIVNGKLVPFIELGVGFNPELTGRENIYLNGALLGFSHEEVSAMYDEIVEFAELEEFMDQKLKNYSSGMQVRLAFSIAIRADGGILVLDEILAVGDEAFQRKCNSYFDKIKKDKKQTVILVTHSMDAVRRYCNKALLIRDGEVVINDIPSRVADEYSRDNLLQTSSGKKKQTISTEPKLSARLLSSPVLSNKDRLIVEAEYRALNDKPVYIKFAPLADGGQSLMTANSKVLYKKTTADTKKHTVRYEVSLKDFNYGNFSVVVMLSDAKSEVNIANYGYNGELSFMIRGSGPGGAFKNQGSMEYIE